MIYVAILATLVHIIVFGTMPIRAIGGAGFDDGLFLSLGRLIESGSWLGDHTALTLAKGPAYPMFIAVSHRLHVPLSISHELLRIVSCAVFTLAVAPFIRDRRWAVALYIVLLFNPVPFETGIMARVLRQHIYAPLGLMTFASLVGCASARTRAGAMAWIGVGGMSLGFFWLTREESVWILAPLAICIALVVAVKHPSFARPTVYLTRTVALFVLAVMPIMLVAAVNKANYGAFMTVDAKERAFKDAYAALLRVEPERRIPFVPISADSRRKVYDVSPAFRELEPNLEGEIGNEAGRTSVEILGEGVEGEIGGGWFYWAFRAAAEKAGHYESPATASEYYRRMATEVNEACDTGRLVCAERMPDFFAPLTTEDLRAIAAELLTDSRSFVGLDGSYARPSPSLGNPEDLERVARFTRSRITSADPQPATLRTKFLSLLALTYRILGLLLSLAILAGAFRVIRRAPGREKTVELSLIGIPLLVGTIAYLGVNAIVSATSFPSSGPGSHVVVYPWFLAAGILMLLDEVRAFRSLSRPGPTT